MSEYEPMALATSSQRFERTGANALRLMNNPGERGNQLECWHIVHMASSVTYFTQSILEDVDRAKGY
ncbi:MAG: hypothetical protein SGI77_19305 [Pirellulaceae bacterium]|nr:hypothetical protein [Pirellulaceae bacterium]